MEQDKNLEEYNEDLIYHYTSLYKFIEKIMRKQELKLNRLRNMDDPFERKTSKNSSGFLSREEEEGTESYQLKEEIIEKRSKAFICSFSTDSKGEPDTYQPLSKGYAKSRMWSQYGDKHKGVCLVFSKKELKAELEKFLGRIKGNYYPWDEKVNYSDKEKDFRDFFNFEKLSGTAFQHLEKYKENLFFKKFRDYQDEDEYRFVIAMEEDTKDESLILNFSKSLKYVIRGDDSDPIYIDLLERYAKRDSWELKKIKWYYNLPILL